MIQLLHCNILDFALFFTSKTFLTLFTKNKLLNLLKVNDFNEVNEVNEYTV